LDSVAGVAAHPGPVGAILAFWASDLTAGRMHFVAVVDFPPFLD
jgi:hypothetical protein